MAKSKKKIEAEGAGSIQMHGGQLQVRHWVTIEGVRVRPWFPLGTTSIGLARAKNRELTKKLARGEVPDVKAAASVELCSEAFARIIEQKRDDGLKSWRGPAQLLRDYGKPVLGHLPITKVTPPHIRDALIYCRDQGRAKATVEMLRTALSGVFKALCRDQLLPMNPVALVPMLKMKKDPRPRQLLTDPEFITFMKFTYAPLRLRTMAMASRSLGGMRTSDLHAWDWQHIDLAEWLTCQIQRSKTGGLSTLAMPPEMVPWLHQWWIACGKPTTGPVFGMVSNPARRCTRAGYARELRYWLQAAGITRAELFKTDDRTKQVDFHSFRRAYCSALAVAGINAQTAMRLASHSKIETHMMYMGRAVPLATPEGIVPATGPAVGPSNVRPLRQKREKVSDIDPLALASGDDGRTCRMGMGLNSAVGSCMNAAEPHHENAGPDSTMGPMVWTIPAPSGRADSQPPLPN